MTVQGRVTAEPDLFAGPAKALCAQRGATARLAVEVRQLAQLAVELTIAGPGCDVPRALAKLREAAALIDAHDEGVNLGEGLG